MCDTTTTHSPQVPHLQNEELVPCFLGRIQCSDSIVKDWMFSTQFNSPTASTENTDLLIAYLFITSPQIPFQILSKFEILSSPPANPAPSALS
jgi:hypothetical protein